MSIKSTLFGPKSKYDPSIPYTYVARMQAIEGDDELHNDYFADTICGLIEYLDENDVRPSEVNILGLYLKQEIPLDVQYCLSPDGEWLNPPELCHALEQHYLETMELAYKGHVEDGHCSYEDRDTQGSGPY
jgi:hypothetical protein